MFVEIVREDRVELLDLADGIEFWKWEEVLEKPSFEDSVLGLVIASAS